MQPVFRFAPSPNGALHLGHALSAWINFQAAKRLGGRFLLRLEDIDTSRCTDEKIRQMLDDLRWLGLDWEEPILCQSKNFPFYQSQLDKLRKKGLVYPSSASRKDITTAIEHWETHHQKNWPRDPDGAPHFPRTMLQDKENHESEVAWRLDMKKAIALVTEPLTWKETGPLKDQENALGTITANPAQWGDVVLARKDCPTSYHLSVVLDDANQAITHVVRGQDLFWATGLHRLLQELFDLPAPTYHHHRLMKNELGEKLSKSKRDLSLKALRNQGVTAQEIWQMVDFSNQDLIAFTPPKA